jgi:tetratricopeptide (TPR) repeat protein
VGLSRAQRLSGDVAGAAVTLEAAVARGGDAAILNEAGAVAYAQGRWTEAAELFERALAAGPPLPAVAANRDRAAAAASLVALLAAPPLEPPKPLKPAKR